MPNDVSIALVCLECSEESDERAYGWKAYLTIENEIAIYCAWCAASEFDLDA